MNKLNFRKNAKGFNLIELMLVLAAIVILSALVFNQYQKYQVSQKAADTAQTLTLAATGIKALYTSGNFSKLSTASAAQGGFFPDSMVDKTAGTITNQFDGAVTVGYATTSNATAITQGASATNVANARYFGIQYTQVPSAVCVKLAGAAGGFNGLAIGTTTVKNVFPNATRMELNEAEVTAACNAAGTVDMLFLSN